MRKFENLHPVVLFVFFAGVLIPNMFLINPGMSLVSWLAGFILFLITKRAKAVNQVLVLVISVIIMALVNGVFSHEGATELFFINKNPVTLEALKYGAATGLMFAVVILWFGIFSEMMTGDKIMAVFRRMPKTGLLTALIMNMVPRYIDRFRKVSMGARINNKTGENKESLMKILSAVFTWALENCMETAGLMEEREYDKAKRIFSVYRFGLEDAVMLGVVIILQGMYFFPEKYRLVFMAVLAGMPLIYIGKEQLCLIRFMWRKKHMVMPGKRF